VRALTRDALGRAAGELAARDGTLRAIVERLGAPPLWARRPGFPTLVRIILEQQVSIVAARTLYERLRRHAGEVTPNSIHAMGERGLRDFGLTRQKARYCNGIAELVLDGSLDLRRVAAAPDEEGRAMLLSVPGIGPWSIDIYFLMALRRPDIWPTGDLALAAALREVKHLDAVPSRDRQQRIAARWAPWRSVAARILWAHYLDGKGQLTPG
jgi:DNA-3-methyladenine glycosylase II